MSVKPSNGVNLTADEDLDQWLESIAGCLLGTALGDALGLPMEGLSPEHINRRFPTVDRFYLANGPGFVSDDTEQTALVSQSLIRSRRPGGVSVTSARFWFRFSMIGWFWRFPFGIGFGTLRACLKMPLPIPQGVSSAGNGAAMRSAVVGVFMRLDPVNRRLMSEMITRTTHSDLCAVEGAVFVSEMAAHLSLGVDDFESALEALAQVTNPELKNALRLAMELVAEGTGSAEAAKLLGTSGFVVHSVPIALFNYLRFGAEPLVAIAAVIRAGGDTDSNAAIVGAWCGTRLGSGGLPLALVERIVEGPFGPDHLRALASALVDPRAPAPSYSIAIALARNISLYPLILGHGIRRTWEEFLIWLESRRPEQL